ncbi:hypothetical protein MYX65_05145 [Acidobacteria bacterium AH-259-L09]|nr:hypothetical protein [Acidobacteria bacterium AH-259-L09]
MAGCSQPPFRQRFCRAQGCGALFWICRSCDRGHRYCSPPCREKARRQQRREANRRHQQSPEGRLDHRDRQRAYRHRRTRARVTDQGRQSPWASASIPASPFVASLAFKKADERPEEEVDAQQRSFELRAFSHFRVVFCVVCGRSGCFVDPFQEGG